MSGKPPLRAWAKRPREAWAATARAPRAGQSAPGVAAIAGATPPGAGVSPLEQRYGINVEDVERWLVAANYAQDWLFHVVRTKKPINDQVKKALHLRPADTRIEGQDYYVTPTNWLEGGNPFRVQDKGADAPTPAAPGTRPLAVRFADAETIVMGDLAPIQEFLD